MLEASCKTVKSFVSNFYASKSKVRDAALFVIELPREFKTNEMEGCKVFEIIC